MKTSGSASVTLIAAIGALLAVIGWPTGASSVTAIVGDVQVPNPPPAVARRPSVADFGMPAPREREERRRAVVYLETAPDPGGSLPAGRAAIDQRGETFRPHVLAVTTGTVVEFPNSDETFHNVFSLSRTKPFDLGRYAAGRSKSVVFDRPGIVRVFCDIHSHMSAFVLVFPHRFFAVTDADSRYRIDDVPPGTYTIVAWHESAEPVRRSIDVPATGGELEVGFVL